MDKLVIGILAHVDAGKTTLSEGILYKTGCLRKVGRVDHGDAFLDTEALEKERGITIFSKQAVFPLGEREYTLLDTPGHVDFSAETERTLSVLDAAVLVISGTDGIQGHTETLWNLLSRHKIPTFLFINKTDLLDAVSPDGKGRIEVLDSLKKKFGDGCIDFALSEKNPDAFYEQAALTGDELLESYLESGCISEKAIGKAVGERKIFPCYFGSALKMEGIDSLLSGIDHFLCTPVYKENFGARVFKVSRDNAGARLTFMKITGGGLMVKSQLSGISGGERWQEKADQLRVYSGAKYKLVEYAPAGSIIAVTGLSRALPGDGLGAEENSAPPVLTPVLTYRLILPEGVSVFDSYKKLSQLEEEDPQLHMVWNEALGEIHLQLMGEIQLEILQRLILERFGLSVSFGEGNIVYKETILSPVEGVGHFEPLRHYAEVHLLLEPGERGSGLLFESRVSEDDLDRNWQRLILTHLEEKEHIGVLTGSPITDMKITLIAGRAHVKHTEGGDFRQATYRAVRQGLMEAESQLLEPWYVFTLTLPQENIGRAMHDIELRFGKFDPPESTGEMVTLTGRAPVSQMRDYQTEVAAYTRGRGKLVYRVEGYFPCHNTEEVIREIGYMPEADLENTADSVFCSHGAGVVVNWREAKEHMHLPCLTFKEEKSPEPILSTDTSHFSGRRIYTGTREEDKELEEIFRRTYGEIKRRDFLPQNTVRQMDKAALLAEMDRADEFLLVDGYNIIFAWEELKAQAAVNLDAARQALIDILENYQGMKRCGLIVVFDAYRVKGGKAKVERQGDVYIVYTEEAETADMYIEKVTYALGKEPRKRRVRVATSDNLEQTIILGHGSSRISAMAFYEEVCQTEERIRSLIERQNHQDFRTRARLGDKMEKLNKDQ